MNEIEYIMDKWKKEEDKEVKNMSDIINNTIKRLYISNQINMVHSIFKSKWIKYIDIAYDNGSILEFAGLIKDKKESINEIIHIIKYIENKEDDKKQNNKKYYKAIHNILMEAVNGNKKELIDYITKEQSLIKIDFRYENYAIIKNCIKQNNNPKKEEILYYFITECELKKTIEIEKILKRNKKEDMLELFDKIELYNELRKNLINNKENKKRIKI